MAVEHPIGLYFGKLEEFHVGDVIPTASIDFNSTNLKITSSKINTIQNINTGASPTFAGLTLNNGANDPQINFSDGSSVDFTIGIDNSDSDTFKLCLGSSLAWNKIFSLTPVGNSFSFHVPLNIYSSEVGKTDYRMTYNIHDADRMSFYCYHTGSGYKTLYMGSNIANKGIVFTSGNNAGINIDIPSVNSDLTLGNEASLCLKEITTPAADADYGKIYCKADNKLYFQSGDGIEHEIAFI